MVDIYSQRTRVIYVLRSNKSTQGRQYLIITHTPNVNLRLSRVNLKRASSNGDPQPFGLRDLAHHTVAHVGGAGLKGILEQPLLIPPPRLPFLTSQSSVLYLVIVSMIRLSAQCLGDTGLPEEAPNRTIDHVKLRELDHLGGESNLP